MEATMRREHSESGAAVRARLYLTERLDAAARGRQLLAAHVLRELHRVPRVWTCPELTARTVVGESDNAHRQVALALSDLVRAGKVRACWVLLADGRQGIGFLRVMA